jgi:hypothetical protein
VRTFRHAVSLDERRAKFRANLWNVPSDQEKKLGLPERPRTPPPRLGKPRHSYTFPLTFPRLPLRSKTQDSTDEEEDPEQNKHERDYSGSHHHPNPPTDVLEVWFAVRLHALRPINQSLTSIFSSRAATVVCFARPYCILYRC